ncbi:MAG: hypothetical protein LPH21_12935 [Shewanella sp.]|nr:hypothetical protein [Shewanella sp.]
MFQNVTYTTMFEYLRRIAKVEVTEQGVYLDGEVPDDYGGAIIQMEVPYEVLMVDSSGQIVQQLYQPPTPLNKNDEPADGLVIDGATAIAGDSPIELITVFNEKLPEDLVKRVEDMISHFEQPEDK